MSFFKALFGLQSHQRGPLKIPGPPQLREPVTIQHTDVYRVMASLSNDRNPRLLDRRYCKINGKDLPKLRSWMMEAAHAIRQRVPYRIDGADCDDLAALIRDLRMLLYPGETACPLIAVALVPNHAVMAAYTGRHWWLLDVAEESAEWEALSDGHGVTGYLLH